MKLKNIIVQKYVCCINITLAARLIGFIGVAVTAILVSILLSDKTRDDYNASRKTALALGLDWQHFHSSANATEYADPEGKFISIIVIVYSVLYLLTSLSLIYATITCIRIYTVPWLLCEMFGCLSKVAALISHAIYSEERYNNTFVIGSVLYILIMTWWWAVVFAAQCTWNKNNSSAFSLPLTTRRISTVSYSVEYGPDFIRPATLTSQKSVMESPIPYRPNDCYTSI